jgi:hypothetical protein
MQMRFEKSVRNMKSALKMILTVIRPSFASKSHLVIENEKMPFKNFVISTPRKLRI